MFSRPSGRSVLIIKEAEEKRRKKHKNLEEERENMRQGIRDPVSFLATSKRLASYRNQ